MAEPEFLLQIVDRNGVVARHPAGGTLERDLIAACADAIAKRGVSAFGRSLVSREDIEGGLRDVISSLKKHTRALA